MLSIIIKKLNNETAAGQNQIIIKLKKHKNRVRIPSYLNVSL